MITCQKITLVVTVKNNIIFEGNSPENKESMALVDATKNIFKIYKYIYKVTLISCRRNIIESAHRGSLRLFQINGQGNDGWIIFCPTPSTKQTST